MPFPREKAKDPKAIGIIKFSASNNPAGNAFKAVAGVQLLNAEDKPIRVVPVDITDELTGPQKTAINNLLTILRTRAEAEILP